MECDKDTYNRSRNRIIKTIELSIRSAFSVFSVLGSGSDFELHPR